MSHLLLPALCGLFWYHPQLEKDMRYPYMEPTPPLDGWMLLIMIAVPVIAYSLAWIYK